MKFYKIQDTLSKCSNFLDVACIALDNRINSCIEELNKMKGNAKNE